MTQNCEFHITSTLSYGQTSWLWLNIRTFVQKYQLLKNYNYYKIACSCCKNPILLLTLATLSKSWLFELILYLLDITFMWKKSNFHIIVTLSNRKFCCKIDFFCNIATIAMKYHKNTPKKMKMTS